MTSDGTLGSSPAIARASSSGVAALGSTGMNDSIALAIEGRPSIANHILQGRQGGIETRHRGDLHGSLACEHPLPAPSRLTVQEQLGVEGPEIDAVDDCVGAVEQLTDGTLADAVGEGVGDESGVDPSQLRRHRLGLVHADRVHVGSVLAVYVRGLELLGSASRSSPTPRRAR